MVKLIKPYIAKSLEVWEIKEIEDSYRIPIKYQDVFWKIVNHIFLTQHPKIEEALSNTSSNLLSIMQSPNNLLIWKLNWIWGIIVDEGWEKLETWSSFMVSIWKWNFNTAWQYWINLKNLINPEITYIFTTNKRQNKNPFPGQLSSQITIKSRASFPNQYEASIIWKNIAGNKCDIEGTLLIGNK